MKGRVLPILLVAFAVFAVGAGDVNNRPTWPSTVQGSMLVDAFTPNDVIRDLEGYWPMTEGTGTAINDLSGNDYTGILYGGAAWDTGPVATLDVPHLDGTNDYMDFGVIGALGMANDFTLMLCINPDTDWNVVSDDFPLLDAGGHDTATSYYILLKVDANNTDKLQYVTKEDTKTKAMFSVRSAWSANEWLHIALTHDTDNEVTFCFDGVCETSTTFFPLATSNYGGLLVGRRDTGPEADPPLYFDGAVANTEIYHRVLTEAEIAQASTRCVP